MSYKPTSCLPEPQTEDGQMFHRGQLNERPSEMGLALGDREWQMFFVPRTHTKDCAMKDVEVQWGWG